MIALFSSTNSFKVNFSLSVYTTRGADISADRATNVCASLIYFRTSALQSHRLYGSFPPWNTVKRHEMNAIPVDRSFLEWSPLLLAGSSDPLPFSCREYRWFESSTRFESCLDSGSLNLRWIFHSEGTTVIRALM